MRPDPGRVDGGARVRRWTAPLALSCALSCGGPPNPARSVGTAPGVEMRDASGKPRIAIVVRDGDPFGAVGVALTHDLGATASVWLGALLAARVRAEVPETRAPRPNGTGLTLSTSAATPNDATRFVRAVDTALAKPFSAEELTRATGTRAIPVVATWRSDGEAATSQCAAELGEPKPRGAPTLAELEQGRVALHSAPAVAFAAVGSRELGEAASNALRATNDWVTSDTVNDAWPGSETSSAASVPGERPALSVAIRTSDVGAALSAAERLGERQGALSVHAGSLDPAWSIERVAAVARPRGACLRVDLRAQTTAALARSADVAALVLDEAGRALDAAATSRVPVRVAEADPRDAAEAAAWRALAGRLPGGPVRAFVSATTPDEAVVPRFSALVADARAARKRSSVEARYAKEAGQAETWMLLASPCATAAETTDNAGATALAVRAVSRLVAEREHTTVEPWVSADGIGLLAHGPSTDVAAVATALARAMAQTPLEDAETTLTRTALTRELEAEAIPLWPAALDALSPKHPSLLDPRGTFKSVNELGTATAESARRVLVRLPLRLAVLAPDDDPKTRQSVSESLERELRPERTSAGACPDLGVIAPRTGAYEVSFADTASAGTRALVAVTLPHPGDLRAEAERTARILNRPGGLLDAAVRVPGLAVYAEASVVGGSTNAAFAVEITTSGKKADDAVAQVRALLTRLSEGAVAAEDLAAVEAAASDPKEASVDPRSRLVSLWLGRGAPKPAPDVAALRRFHRAVFGADRHLVVVAKPRL